MFFNSHTHCHSKNDVAIFQRNILEKDFVDSWFSIGIHPQDSINLFDYDVFEREINQKKCLAIGEIGLDKLIEIPLDKQFSTFKRQIEFSEHLELPVILHCVKAWNEVLAIRKKMNCKQQWIFHGFRKVNLLESVIREKMMISIGTAVLYDLRLQAIIPKIPEELLLLETDMDTENSIESVYECVSTLKNISLQELEIQIHKNFKNTFQKWQNG
jgi:TatD DNase family protein